MAKALKVVALVAVAVAVVVFAAPIAAGLTAAGGAIFGSSFAIAASAVVAAGLTIGLAAIGTLFRKAPSLSSSMADRLNASINPTAPRKIVFGRTAGGADVRFNETYGSKKDRHAQVIAVASHKVNAIKQFWHEDTLSWSNGVIVGNQSGIRRVVAQPHGQRTNGVALGSGSYWSTTSSFTGSAYVGIEYNLDAKAWPSGVPQKITTVVEGCPLYDPRLDSTRGGSGSHRVEDQSTWGFLNGSVEIGRNPALALLTYLIGYRINGQLVWGMGLPVHVLDLDNFREYANMCEERVQVIDGGTVQRYTCDAIFSTADTHESVISAITAGMGSCKLTDVGGYYSLIGGYDDTIGPIQDLTDDDLVAAPGSTAPYSYTVAGPTRETYNISTGKFANPDELWQLADWGSIKTDNLADGIPRTVKLDFATVDRPETCQRIAKQFIAREAKTPGFFSATFGPRAFTVQVGSLVYLTIRNQGWNKKLFRVEEQTETHDLIFQMRLREESSEVYAWDKNEGLAFPTTIRPPGYDPTTKIAVEGLSLTSTTYEVVN